MYVCSYMYKYMYMHTNTYTYIATLYTEIFSIGRESDTPCSCHHGYVQQNDVWCSQFCLGFPTGFLE